MLVLVGPSASGKSAIVKCLEQEHGLKKFITCTTRNMRRGEVDGVDYYFMSTEEFNNRYMNDEFIETVYYNGNYYGTLKSECCMNKVVILEPQGLKKFLASVDDIYAVFLHTDEEILKERMLSRGDSYLEMMTRIENDRLIFSDEQLSEVDFTVNTTSLSIGEISSLIMKRYKDFCTQKAHNLFDL